jgi:acyl-CoA synthetase (AMP-forming)/AMP-acid ligase II/NAD(P)-dependent dehydrogenase (short-subunit alcohol dehydrogenase family)
MIDVVNRLAHRLVNPMGGPDPAALRAAVSGRVVLVTGASFGIGEATARALAAAGATVLLMARSAERLRAIAAELIAAGGLAHAYPVDLADGDAVAAAAAEMLARHGHVDVVVSNAGKSIRRSLALSYDRARDFERTIDVNYLGPVRLLLALLPSMRARGRGHVVNISTIGARVPPGPRWGAYQASKIAFDVWLRSVAPELRGDGVAVSTVYMALVHTRMSAPTTIFRRVPGLSPDQAAALVGRAIVARPREIAPWWLAPAEVAGAALRGPVDALLGGLFRVTRDTASARGEAEAGSPPGERWLAARAVRELARAGAVRPVRPDRWPRLVRALRAPVGPALAGAVAAAGDPDATAVLDERGVMSFGQLDRAARRLAAALRDRHQVGPGRGLAVMCRNHRGFVIATLAAAHLGADLLLLNTEFPGPQLRQALVHHVIGAAVLDDEFAPAFDDAGFAGPRVTAWTDGGACSPTIDDLVAAGGAPLPPVRRQGAIVILTSGTTGTPKGAPRTPDARALLGPLTTVLAQIPLRAGAPIAIGPPLFHGFGLAYLALALVVRAPLILRRRFDAEAALAAIARHRAVAFVGVPLMLQRLLDLPADVRARHDASSLRAAISGGAPLAPHLATGFQDRFGDILYNLYGSTEVGFGAIAGPADLRAAPGTVGRAPLGGRVRILDAAGAEVAAGAVGRIFVGGSLAAAGYSGGGGKERRGDLLDTGDLGHVDADGRLFVDGRQDDMIVSGGENVFPQEIEDALAGHGDVAEVAVIGVSDPEYGQRLRAFVVVRAGASRSADALRDYLRRRVARYKLPRDLVFVDQLPRTATGKIARARLPRDGAAA